MTSLPTSGADPAQIIVWVDGQAWYGLDGHVIGRDNAASITVDHAQVSRRHAVLAFDGATWSIRDLGSVNGLHDEGGRREVIVLPPGRTQVWLGPPETSPSIYFDVSAPPAAAPAPPAPVAPEPAYQPPVYQDPGYRPPVYRDPGYQPPAPPPGSSAGYQPPVSSSGPGPAPPPSGLPSSGLPSSGLPSSGLPSPPTHLPAAPPPPGTPTRSPGQFTSALNANSLLLEQNLGEMSQVIQVARNELIIGRSVDCDLSIADPLMSRRHARLLLQPGGGRIVDLGSDNGTFVNGQRVLDSPLAEGDLIEMGKSQFVLTGGRLQQHVAHGLPLQAANLTVKVGNQMILSDVSFTLPPGSMTAVIGPSGSGKSTLLNALTGRRPADQGRVVLGGRDLYGSDEGLGRRIGFVPQDDPVHDTLTVRHALQAAARLRLPSDVSRAEIRAGAEQVAGELGLSERLETRIKALSGGQRKRVSVGYELVGTPQALILDEPTSGLDPGMERDLMSNLRRLADKGTTTIVVTHSVQSVELCDLVLVLAPGGRLAFIGPPSKVGPHFNCPDLASVFTLLSSRPRADWELEFASTTSYLKFGAPAPIATAAPASPLPARSFSADLRVMLVRYVRSLLGDRRRLILLLAQAPILGAIVAALLDRDAFTPGSGGATRQYVLATVLSVTLLGSSNSVREIVQERDVFRRERAAGVSAVGFVVSRFLVLGLALAVQAVVLHLVANTRQRNPIGSGALLASGQAELMLALVGVGVVSVGIGLLISSLVDDTSKALAALIPVIVPTLLLSGVMVATSGKPILHELTYLNPVQWGASAASVAVDVRGAENCGPELVADQGGFINETCGNPLWARTATAQALNFGALVLWSVILMLGAGAAARWSLSRPIKRS